MLSHECHPEEAHASQSQAPPPPLGSMQASAPFLLSEGSCMKTPVCPGLRISSVVGSTPRRLQSNIITQFRAKSVLSDVSEQELPVS